MFFLLDLWTLLKTVSFADFLESFLFSFEGAWTFLGSEYPIEPNFSPYLNIYFIKMVNV